MYPKNGIITALIIFVFSLFFCFPSFSSNQIKYERFQQEIEREKSLPKRIIKTEKYYDEKRGEFVDVAAGEIIVKFKPIVNAQAVKTMSSRNNLKIIKRVPKLFLYQFSVSSESLVHSVAELLSIYRNDPLVEYAEPNYLLEFLATTPNDSYYDLQWALPKIEANLGWDYGTGNSDVVVAIIDSGVDVLHEDLIAKIWTNSIENMGSNWNNGNDDDGNGYIDDWVGWDFYDGDNLPIDEDGHGTHVAGIAAASSNNSIGVTGMSWNSEIMVLRIPTLAFESALAIYYAADNGAKVFNCSWRVSSDPGYLYDAIQYAHGQGCIIIAAAGNDGDTTINYPAGYSNVISVGSVDRDDNRSSFSVYNSSVDVVAPGGDGAPADSGDILSTYPNDFYSYNAGTSMAAPFVSGLAALLFSQNPSWTNTDVENRIIDTVDDLGTAGRDDYYGYGRINAYNALFSPPASPEGFAAQSGETSIVLSWNANTESDLAGYRIYRSTSATGTYSLVATAAASATSYTDTITPEGTYYYKISAFDLSNCESSLTGPIVAYIDRTDPPAPTPVSVPTTTNTANLTISGTMSADTVEILVNGSSSGVTYSGLAQAVGDTNWSYLANLSQGVNNFSIVARDVASNESTPFTFSITLSTFNIYPNPFTIGSAGGVTFAGFAGDERINIYTITGELVISHQLTGSPSWTWDTLNTAGKQVASGIYIYLIRDNAGGKIIGKIALK